MNIFYLSQRLVKSPYVLLLVCGATALSACTIPQQMDLIEREQRRLRVENAEVLRENRAIREELNSARSSLADTRANLQQMERNLTALKEKVEEIRVQIGRQIGQSSRVGDQRMETLQSQVAKIEDTLRAQEELLKVREDELRMLREALQARQEGMATAPPESGGAIGFGGEKKPGGTDSASMDYEEALKLLDRKDYKASIARFKEFLQKHPNSDYADNAQYWIGESYYALRQFDQAILEFDLVRRNYPNGDKVPASLLKLGFAFAEIGDKVDARLILQELVDRYPQSEEATKAKEKIKSLGA